MGSSDYLSTLRRLREDSLNKENHYQCNKCKDSMIIFVVDETGHRYAKDCDCAIKSNAIRYMRNSGIDENDLKKSFNDFNTLGERELEIAKATTFSYATRFRGIMLDRFNSLLLCGKPGTGKTTLGLSVVNLLLNDGVPALYVSYREMITELKQLQYGNEDSKQKYEDKMERLKNVDLLFIDDLFKGSETDADKSLMYDIINFRYLKRKPIIVSTEKLPSELIKVDEALGSRIIEMCKGYTVIFKDAQNYRLR